MMNLTNSYVILENKMLKLHLQTIGVLKINSGVPVQESAN